MQRVGEVVSKRKVSKAIKIEGRGWICGDIFPLRERMTCVGIEGFMGIFLISLRKTFLLLYSKTVVM